MVGFDKEYSDLLSDPSSKLSESLIDQEVLADPLIFWPNLSFTRSGIAGTC